MCKLSGLDFEERTTPIDDPDTRAELLLLSPSVLVPRLEDGRAKVWDTLSIGEYLNETHPEAGLLPADPVARAHCRSISGEMHSGFANLRSALPMNIKARYEKYRIFAGALQDIERVTQIWRECLASYGGPFLFGSRPTLADAMYAPVCVRFLTYSVPLDEVSKAYRDTILNWAPMKEWIAAALEEHEDLEELDVEF